MKHPTVPFAALSLACALCTSGVQAAQWAKSFGTDASEAGAVIPASGGGFHVLAYRSTASNGSDAVFATLDAAGAVKSAKRIGGAKDDYLTVLPLANGYLVTGSTNSYPAPGSARANIVWAKFDANWKPVYAKVFGGSATDEYGSFTKVSDGGLLFAGSRTSYPAQAQPDSDILLINTRADGSLKWKKLLHHGSADNASQVIEVTDGYIVGGSLASPNQTGSGILLMKLAKAAGGVTWKKLFKAGTPGDIFVGGTLTKVSGGFVVTGLLQPSNPLLGGARTVIAKINANGGVVWSKVYGANGLGITAFIVSENAADSTLLVSGTATDANFMGGSFGNTKSFVMRLNSATGAIALQKRFGSASEFTAGAVIRSADVVYLTGAYGMNMTEYTANPKVLYSRLNASTLAPVWAKTFGGPSPNAREYGGVAKISSGYLLSGTTYSFGASTDTKSDVFALTLDADGNYPNCFIDTLDLATSNPSVTAGTLTLAVSSPAFTARTLGNPAAVTLQVADTTLQSSNICSPVGG